MRTEPLKTKLGVGAWGLLLATVAALGLPAAAVAVDVVRGIRVGPGEWWWLDLATVGRSALWAGVIGLLAATLGAPIAWVCRPARSWWALLLAGPALFPSFLAYSGWGIVRQPGTWTGDWIDRVRESGWTKFPHAVDTALAVGGLSLWAAPLAAGLMLAGLREVGDDALEAASLEGGERARIRVAMGGMGRPWLFAAAAIGAMMLGTAIPLHLARVETAAILLWGRLDLTPPDKHWQVWVAAWPLVLAAVGLAWALTRSFERPQSEPVALERGSGWAGKTLAMMVVGLGVAAPLVFFASDLSSGRMFFRYARDNWNGVCLSAGVALAFAGVAVTLALAAWQWGCESGGDGGRGVARVAALWTAAALLPGVMVGSAVSRGFALLDSLGVDLTDTWVPMLAAHTIRFGFLAIWAGYWLSKLEPEEARWRRRLDGAEGVTGWLRGTVAAWPGALAGTAAVALTLAFQEIESVVLTLSPGGSLLARRVLDDLHFFRKQELAAGVLVMAAVAIAASGIVIALVRDAAGSRGQRGQGGQPQR